MVLDEEAVPRDLDDLFSVAGELERELEAQNQRVAPAILREPLLPGLIARLGPGFGMRQRNRGLVKSRARRQSLHRDHCCTIYPFSGG